MSRPETSKKIKQLVLIAVFFGAIALFILHKRGLYLWGEDVGNDRRFYFLLSLGAPFAAFLYCAFAVWTSERRKKEERKPAGKLLIAAAAAGNAFLSFFLIELMNNSLFSEMDFRYKLLGWGITFVFDLIFIGLFNSLTVGMIVGNLFFLVWGIVNYFVMSFRSVPLRYIDFFSARTALNVAGNYELEWTWPILTAASLTISAISVYAAGGLRRIFSKMSGRILVRGAALVLAAAFYALLFRTPFLENQKIVLADWNPQYTYNHFGMEAGFLAFAKHSVPEAPEGYSESRVRDIIAASMAEGEEEQSFPVVPENVIVIMNESFSDLSIYPELKTTEYILPYFDSLTENTIKGDLLVSVLGGTTANTEYEFLTGNSCMFSPSTIVYNSFIKSDQFSMARTLKSQGYRTVAMHPFSSSGWNRLIIYPYMGFDESIFEEGYKGSDYERGFISDKSDYVRLVQEVEEKEEGEKLFIFNITIQNHGSYKDENYPSTVHFEGYDGEYLGQAEQYETLIRKSDESLEYLIDYFKGCDEKTMIIFFGDHQPALSDDFLEYAFGKARDEFSFAEEQTKYVTKYFIWANYELPEITGETLSANNLGAYALSLTGLESTGYSDYLLDLRETVPAVNAYGYLTADGTMHQHGSGDDPEAEMLLEDYKCLIYNELTANEGRDKSFFGVDESE